MTSRPDIPNIPPVGIQYKGMGDTRSMVALVYTRIRQRGYRYYRIVDNVVWRGSAAVR